MPRILLVTGEASGDLHGANLAKAINQQCPDAQVWGVGGQHMVEAGVTLVPGIERVDAIGVPGLAQLWKGWRTLRRLKTFLRSERFDAVVLIDCPGMNLRLAKTAAKAKHRVVYYIAPQIWAWGTRRLRTIKRVVNRVIVIFPFEEDLYRRAGVACDFVGHPLLDSIPPTYDRTALREQFGVAKEQPVIGLLPGSRDHEVQTLLGVMLQAAENIQGTYPEVQFILAQARSVHSSVIHRAVQGSRVPVRIVADHPNEVIAACDLLMVASGTATLQAGIIGTPMVITYRVSSLTYQIAKRLVTLPYIGLVNIVAGRFVVPELVQHDLTVERLSQEMLRLLSHPALMQDMQGAFRRLRESLGKPGASQRAAEIVLREARA